jgi:Pyridoxamine 5'-phosphate oxidase like
MIFLRLAISLHFFSLSMILFRKVVPTFRDHALSRNRSTRSGFTREMSMQDGIERVWDIIEKVGVCMLTTQFESGLRARPLEARPDRAAGIIWFVTDLRSGKEHEIEAEQFGIGTLGPGSRSRARPYATFRPSRSLGRETQTPHA